MAGSEEWVAVISHGGIMDVLLKALLGQLPGEHIGYSHHKTAISRLSVRLGAPIVVRFVNRVDHLAPELVP